MTVTVFLTNSAVRFLNNQFTLLVPSNVPSTGYGLSCRAEPFRNSRASFRTNSPTLCTRNNMLILTSHSVTPPPKKYKDLSDD